MYKISIILLLLFSGEVYGQIVPIGIAREVQQLKQQVGLINADVTGIESRIHNLEMQVNAQAGIINKISQNSGTQIFTGDVAAVTVVGLVILVAVLVWGGFYYQKSIYTEQAARILAHTKSEEEGKQLAKEQSPQVRKIIEQALED